MPMARVLRHSRRLLSLCPTTQRTKIHFSTSMFERSEKPHLYLELSGLPIPTSAGFLNTDVIRVSYSTQDGTQNIKRSTSKTFFVTPNSVSASLSEESGDVVASIVSPSLRYVAILRESPDQSVSGGKKRFVEIWSGANLEASLDVTSRHGSFNTDEYLSSLSFSPSEDTVLYTAEANPPSSTDDKDAKKDPYERFRFMPQFGEGIRGKKRPTTFIFRWRSSAGKSDGQSKTSLTTLTFSQPSSGPISLGQAVFTSEDRIMASGYEQTPEGRLLGVKGCYNHPAGIWELVIQPPTYEASASETTSLCTATKLTTSDCSSRSPRVIHDDALSMAFWISNDAGGAHASCVSLHSRDLNSGEVKTVVDIVWEPRGNEFPGLYTDTSLPTQPFLKIGSTRYIVTHSTWGSRTTVLLISTEDGGVREITPVKNDELYSWKVLATDGKHHVICSRSTLTIPHEVVLGRFDDSGSVSWRLIDKPKLSREVESSLESLQISIMTVPDRHPTELILLRSKQIVKPKSAVLPCVNTLHGGPHATSTTAFTAQFPALALQGYTLSLPNYTGSLGFGEKYVKELLGKCGSLDVEDCMASVRHLIKLGICNPGPQNQFIQGGSHGGFLAAHLIGQFPDSFGAAVIRNPVISAAEPSTSDIPDWSFEEFGIPFQKTTIMTPELFEKLYRMSPIAHIDAVRAPVLLLVGEDDQRAAPTQAINYYHALKGRGKAVDMFCFPKESHPLDGVEAAKISWEAGRDWLDFALKKI